MTSPRSAAEVNRHIAELSGWHTEEHLSDDPEFGSRGIIEQTLFRPDGSEARILYQVPGQERDIWQHALDYWHDPRAVFAALPAVRISGKCYDVLITEHVDGSFTATIVQDTPPLGRTGKWMGGDADTREAALAFEAILTAQAGEGT